MNAPGGVLLLLLMSLPLGNASAQDLLPPGPGWTVAGAAALIDRFTPSVIAARSVNRIGGVIDWSLAASRPFGVAGLRHGEVAVMVSRKIGAAGGFWRQLEGDGLRLVEADLSVGLPLLVSIPLPSAAEPVLQKTPVITGVWIGFGAGFQALSGAGVSRFGTGVMRLGVLTAWKDGWMMAVAYRGGFGRNRDWIRQWFGVATGRAADGFAVRAGGLWQKYEKFDPSLALTCHLGNLRIDLGARGVPVAPAAGMHLVVKEICWSVEGRWVRGLGLHLLWSVGSPRLWRQ